MRNRKSISVIAAACTLGCGVITGDLDRIIAIELAGDLTRSLEEGTTLILTATALDASGDPVPDAEIIWRILDVDSAQQIGFTLDSMTGLVTAVFPSSARVQARVDNLRSGPVTVTVTGAPDSLTPVSDTIITLTDQQTKSSPMQVQVLDLTTSPGEVLGLSGKTVRFTLPGGPLASAFLTLADTVVGNGAAVDAETSGTGIAQAFLALVEEIQGSDTVMVEAEIVSENGAPIPGSPARFTVIIGTSQ